MKYEDEGKVPRKCDSSQNFDMSILEKFSAKVDEHNKPECYWLSSGLPRNSQDTVANRKGSDGFERVGANRCLLLKLSRACRVR